MGPGLSRPEYSVAKILTMLSRKVGTSYLAVTHTMERLTLKYSCTARFRNPTISDHSISE